MNAILMPMLMQFLPSLRMWMTGKDSEDVADHAQNLVKTVVGSLDPQNVLHTLTKQPELLIQLQKSWTEYEVSLIEKEVQDRKNARQREILLYEKNHKRWRGDIMALGAVLGLMGCLVILIYGPHLTGEVVGIVSTIAGIFGSCLKDVYAFEFGSSRSSREKTALLSSRS